MKSESGAQEIYHAIVVNESFTGACLAARNDGVLTKNQVITVKVGNMSEVGATVIWLEQLDNDVIKFGIEYQN